VARGLLTCLLVTAVVASLSMGQNEPSGTNPPGNLPPDVIIQRYIEACGGPALDIIKAESRTGTLMRGVTGKVPLVTHAGTGGRWCYDQTFAWGGQISFRSDGTRGWIVDTDSAWSMPEEQRRDLQLVLDFQAPLKMSNLFPQMTTEGTDSVGGKEAIVVLATAPDGTSTELAFDRESGLLLRAGQVYFDDYRPVGEVSRPHRVLLGETVGEEHRQMIMEFSEITHHGEIDNSLFSEPGCVLALRDAPLYTRRVQVEVPIEALDACAGSYQIPGDTNVIWEVARQQSHLMIKRSGPGTWYEIKPESATDYFIGFLNAEFHFVKDSTGGVTSLEFGKSRARKALRIK